MLLLLEADHSPKFSWSLVNDTISVDGRIVNPDALFIRYDVFTELTTASTGIPDRANGWYTATLGWGLTHPKVRLLNRQFLSRIINKPYVLHLARSVGLETPATLVSNDIDTIHDAIRKTPLIAKPVAGGSHCQDIDSVLSNTQTRNGRGAMPCIIQSRLVSPEIRIYNIAGEFFAFELQSEALDYRTDPNCKILPLALSEIPPALLSKLAELMGRLNMNFGAADFKSSSTSGSLQFLELNSAPMFVAFDNKIGGRIADAILNYLL